MHSPNNVVSRWCVTATVLVLAALSAEAQVTSRTTPSDVRRLLSDVLDIAVPDSAHLSSIPVRTRGLALDRDRIRTALDLRSIPRDSSTATPRGRSFSDASITTVADCHPRGRGACAALGDRVYVVTEVLAMDDSSASVRVLAHWADRTYANASRNPRVYRVGYMKLLPMKRGAGGRWRVDGSVRTSVF